MKNNLSLRKLSTLCLVAGTMVMSAPAFANEFQLTLNVAAGATSVPIAVPGINTPVSVTCVQNSVGNRGVGQATILRVSPAAFLEWVGMDIANSGVPSTGFTSGAGAHIIFCDFSKLVDLQVASATQLQIKNTGAGTQSVVINFVY
jgi:hypothetical protein